LFDQLPYSSEKSFLLFAKAHLIYPQLQEIPDFEISLGQNIQVATKSIMAITWYRNLAKRFPTFPATLSSMFSYHFSASVFFFNGLVPEKFQNP